MRIPASLLLLIPFVLVADPCIGQQRSIEFKWLNQPCGEMINCADGCSACNEPEGGDMVVLGTNPALVGVSACPHPVRSGDNALLLSGWTTVPDDARRILISGIAQVPVRIDSVIVVHGSGPNGPTGLLVGLRDLNDGEGHSIDVAIGRSIMSTEMTGCGVIEKPASMAYGSFQLQLQAYGGGGGDWVLDEVRIVVTELEEQLTTGLLPGSMAVLNNAATNKIDLLGRTLSMGNETGMLMQRGRTVIVP